MDMLLVGTISQGHDGGTAGQRCISLDEERTQMAIWSISSAPLIMGNDMRVRRASLGVWVLGGVLGDGGGGSILVIRVFCRA